MTHFSLNCDVRHMEWPGCGSAHLSITPSAPGDHARLGRRVSPFVGAPRELDEAEADAIRVAVDERDDGPWA
jgi:hypothetical protein